MSRNSISLYPDSTPEVYAVCQPWLKGFDGQDNSIASNAMMLGFYGARFWIDQNLEGVHGLLVIYFKSYPLFVRAIKRLGLTSLFPFWDTLTFVESSPFGHSVVFFPNSHYLSSSLSPIMSRLVNIGISASATEHCQYLSFRRRSKYIFPAKGMALESIR